MPLDGRFDDCEDQHISDGSFCRYKDEVGDEKGFPGGTFPSGGFDVYDKIKGWHTETMPKTWSGVVHALGERNIDHTIEPQVDTEYFSADKTCKYRIISNDRHNK